jgi:hypothetical protein
MSLNFRALWALALPLGLWALFPGCARQPEGARCSRTNGNLDCEDPGTGLVCTLASELRGGDDKVDRCCPPKGEPINDDRCDPRIGGGGGGDGDGGEGGTLNEGGSGSGTGGQGGSGNPNEGAICDYNSDCDEPLVCGPRGRCQFECVQDRDCAAGFVCTLKSCVAADSAP